VPKLSDRTVNGELLRYLAKTANDEQPGIRTNTTICLGKIARNLGTNVSFNKVLTLRLTDLSPLDSHKGAYGSIH
jgi:SCY1-like protein 1